MKDDDVTDAMVEKFRVEISDGHNDKQIIAAAVNAVEACDEPITAEWLDSVLGKSVAEMLWDVDYQSLDIQVIGINGQYAVCLIQDDQAVCIAKPTMRRQLLCLLTGLGIGVKK